jgi:polar amino acid transport system substrate-binding protein
MTTPEATQAAIADLAPDGTIKAAINVGNSVLAQRDKVTGALGGVSVDLATELGRRLQVPLELVPFESAGSVAGAARTGAWTIAFMAIDPARAVEIAYTTPYVVIEATYMVPESSPLRTIADVDRQGVRIAVSNNSAYDLHLKRTIKHAILVRASSPAESLTMFLRDQLEAAAGVRQPLERFAAEQGGLRVMTGRFTRIEQAMCVPKGRAAGALCLQGFIAEMKASGFVAEGLRKSGQDEQLAA